MNDFYTRDHDRITRADQLGLAFVKTLVLLNGGAIISVLGFLGSASAQTIVSIEVSHILWAIAAFLVSIVVLLLALGISYTFYAVPEENPYSQFWNKWIVFLNAFAMVVSLAGFTCGVIALLTGVTTVT